MRGPNKTTLGGEVLSKATSVVDVRGGFKKKRSLEELTETSESIRVTIPFRNDLSSIVGAGSFPT